MCPHKLWPTAVSHPLSSLNSCLDLAGGEHYQKYTKYPNSGICKGSITQFCPSGLLWHSNQYLGLWAACWALFICHHKLWPTSMSHPLPSLNSCLGLAGGKHYQKISILRLVQNFALPGCLPYIFFSIAIHRKIIPMAISGPRFHAPLHISPPPPGPAGGPLRTWRGGSARWRQLMQLC